MQKACPKCAELEAEIARLKDRMIDMMPIAGGNPMRTRIIAGGVCLSSAGTPAKVSGWSPLFGQVLKSDPQ